MMNSKQQEIFDDLIRAIQAKHSQVQIASVTELDANSYWISIAMPSDEDEEFEARDLLADLATDVLVDYGFNFRFVMADPGEVVCSS